MHNKIAHIITTHERPRVAQRLINSIRNHYGNKPNIYICDDSRERTDFDGAYNVPPNAYDIGLSAKRNHLVQRTNEPYIFVWDDDYICTEDTDIRKFFDLIESQDDIGVVGGNWTFGKKRDNWFTGEVDYNGTIAELRHPSETLISASNGRKVGPWVRVMFTPNWFLACRGAVEWNPWDESLPLQEHIEWFTRLAALRAPLNEDWPYNKLDWKWRKRYIKRATGNNPDVVDKDGNMDVYLKTTIQNRKYLGGRKMGNQWIKVPEEYGKQLVDYGYAETVVQMDDARPFYLPDVPEDVPLGVALVLDTTCIHDRHGSNPERYNKQRSRKWVKQKKQKMGITEERYSQWQRSPIQEDWNIDKHHYKLPELS